jgi:hypothetical protein
MRATLSLLTDCPRTPDGVDHAYPPVPRGETLGEGGRRHGSPPYRPGEHLVTFSAGAAAAWTEWGEGAHDPLVSALALRASPGTNRNCRALHARSTTQTTTPEGVTTSTMATDYDSPRKTDDEMSEDSLEELKARRQDKSASAVDVDEADLAESLELPGADLSNEELSVRVLPRQADEFTCSRCFLVHHRSQLAKEVKGQLICKECAA